MQHLAALPYSHLNAVKKPLVKTCFFSPKPQPTLIYHHWSSSNSQQGFGPRIATTDDGHHPWPAELWPRLLPGSNLVTSMEQKNLIFFPTFLSNVVSALRDRIRPSLWQHIGGNRFQIEISVCVVKGGIEKFEMGRDFYHNSREKRFKCKK